MPFTIVCKKLSEVSADAVLETVFADPGTAAGRAWVKSVDASLSDGSGMSFRKVIQAEIPSSVSKEESARQLSLAYRDALGLAIKNGCGSVVFSPLPSGGNIPDDALGIASSAVSKNAPRLSPKMSAALSPSMRRVTLRSAGTFNMPIRSSRLL